MSRDYFVFCVDCQSRHAFNDANHQAPLMRHLVAHVHAIAALTPLITAAGGDLELRTAYGAVDPSWFLAHEFHDLRVIDEYGKLDGQCGRRVRCPSCPSEHWCRHPHGHSGVCSP